MGPACRHPMPTSLHQPLIHRLPEDLMCTVDRQKAVEQLQLLVGCAEVEPKMPVCQTRPTGTKHQPSSAPPLPAAPYAHPTALRRTRRRRSTMRAATWPQQAPPSPFGAAAGGVRHRACGAAPAREHSPVLCTLPTRTPLERHLNPVLRAGGRVAATALPPPARGSSSATICMGKTAFPRLSGCSTPGQCKTIQCTAVHTP